MKIKRITAHILSLVIIAGVCMLAFRVNPKFYVRIIETLRDIKSSTVCYFYNFIGKEKIPPSSVTEYSSLPYSPVFSVPFTWVEFKVKWMEYWGKFASKDNVIDYLIAIVKRTSDASRFLILFMPILLAVVLLRRMRGEVINNDYNKDTLPLKIYKRFLYYPSLNMRKSVSYYIDFIKDNLIYLKLLLFVLAVILNGAVIIGETIAFVLYFSSTFDFTHIYTQFYKLFCDLSVPIRFTPWPISAVVAYIIFCKIREKIGCRVLIHHELCNRGFINSQPVVTMSVGSMGSGKTTMVADMVLSREVMNRDKALELMITTDMRYPMFPWVNLECELKNQMKRHKVFNLANTARFIDRKRKMWERKTKKKSESTDIFGYDIKRYSASYDDGLTVSSIWDSIRDYAQLFIIYVCSSSLILSNFAVRSGGVLYDEGNLPVWTDDFFSRHSVDKERMYRYSHILDFDTLRLGVKMRENNINANALEFGVIAITEIGKERGNALENKSKKKNDMEANQNNDGMNNAIKMIRHRATVCNYCFVSIFTDEQRAASWGADARELCNIINIMEKGERKLAYPLFGIEEFLYNAVFSRFVPYYKDHRFRRGDNTLIMFLFRRFCCFISKHYERIHNRFDYFILKLECEKGTMREEAKTAKYYISTKKTYADRFKTDCIADFFRNMAQKSTVGLDDLAMYGCTKATLDELTLQNSYFIEDMRKAN